MDFYEATMRCFLKKIVQLNSKLNKGDIMRVNLRVLWLGPVLFLLFAPIFFFAESFSGKCVGVIDGDTIRVMRDGRVV